MATKQKTIDKIQEFLTLNPVKTSRVEHESFLFSAAESMLEQGYATTINETHTSNSVTTPVTAELEYEVEIHKVFRRATLFINVVNTSSGFLSGIPFKITNVSGNEYIASPSQLINYQLFDSNGVSVRATITATATETNILLDTLPNSTSFKGIIIYNTVN